MTKSKDAVRTSRRLAWATQAEMQAMRAALITAKTAVWALANKLEQVPGIDQSGYAGYTGVVGHTHVSRRLG